MKRIIIIAVFALSNIIIKETKRYCIKYNIGIYKKTSYGCF